MAGDNIKIATSLKSTITLNDGVEMPLFGLGTFRIMEKEEGVAAMVAALKHGYIMLDTATIYGNECDVGRAIKESGVKREDLFVVTKVHCSSHGYNSTMESIKQSLQRLHVSYIDLILLHVPVRPKILETYDAMHEMKRQGAVRSVGVSNFKVEFLEELQKAGRPIPSVNQIEFHGFCTRRSQPIVDYCRKNSIAVMGWGPMAKAKMFEDFVLKKLAEKYKKSVAQIMIRWSVQQGAITIPKSSNAQRVIENADVFDWSLSQEDEVELGSLPHWSSFEEQGIDIINNCWEELK